MVLQWIQGATNYFYVATQTGDYNLISTDADGCEVEAVIFNVIAGVEFGGSGLRLKLFPNPAQDQIRVWSSELGDVNIKVSVHDLLGKQVEQFSLPALTNRNSSPPLCSIDISQLQPGIYILEITAAEITGRLRFVKK